MVYKALGKSIVALIVLFVIAAVAYKPAMNYWIERNRPHWETETVTRGDAIRVINSTGTINPVLSIPVGSFVSGPITEINVDFNDEVKAGDVLAKIDPRLYATNVARDEAMLSSRRAEVSRTRSQLEQAKKAKARGQRLRTTHENFLSDSEMEALHFECEGLEALLQVGEASVLQALASLDNSKANLEYTEIKSPVDGVIIKRTIDPGQTLAAQFQTPELFVVAPDLKKKVHVFASVDEADIGLIQKAQREKRPVTFTVDAHPGELFHGEIEQIRVSSTAVQNVVTYPVIVAAPNLDWKLLPGMTASISFEVDSMKDALKVPNSALRFFPEDPLHVRPEDRDLLDGSRWKKVSSSATSSNPSAIEKSNAEIGRTIRHVWVNDGDFLRAVEVGVGFSENRTSVILSGDLKDSDQLVSALAKKK